MAQTKVLDKIETHISYSITFFENRAIYEIMGKYVVEQGRTQLTVWRMRIACWIQKATDTKSGYVIFTAFPWQQWMQESSSILRLYIETYIACLVSYGNV